MVLLVLINGVAWHGLDGVMAFVVFVVLIDSSGWDEMGSKDTSSGPP